MRDSSQCPDKLQGGQKSSVLRGCLQRMYGILKNTCDFIPVRTIIRGNQNLLDLFSHHSTPSSSYHETRHETELLPTCIVCVSSVCGHTYAEYITSRVQGIVGQAWASTMCVCLRVSVHACVCVCVIVCKFEEGWRYACLWWTRKIFGEELYKWIFLPSWWASYLMTAP